MSSKIPKEAYDYQVETKPTIAGTFFNADVLQEACQKILILRDNLTSFTDAMVIKNETISTIRDALMILISRLRIDQKVTVRVDAHSTLKALQKDQILRENMIYLEIGSAKNKNKNSVAEKAISEIRKEMLKLNPSGKKISEPNLAMAVKNLNSRVRHSGCSARELWTKRDQNMGYPLSFTDEQLSDAQYKMRLESHESSSKYESRNAKD